MAAVLYTLLPRFKELLLLEPSIKPPCWAVFSFTEQEITSRRKGSQEDPFKNMQRNLNIQQKTVFFRQKKSTANSAFSLGGIDDRGREAHP